MRREGVRYVHLSDKQAGRVSRMKSAVVYIHEGWTGFHYRTIITFT